MANVPTELLSDFRALARWLIASDIVTSPKAKAVVRGWRQSSEAAAFPEELIAFRERLRETVVRMESGLLPTGAFQDEVNSLLLQHSRHSSVRMREKKMIRETLFEPRTPTDLWAPIIDATADLLTETESSRIRKWSRVSSISTT
jgi:hypothetical protein